MVRVIVASRHTLAQRFALGVAERFGMGVQEQVLREAYDAAEKPRALHAEQESYYRLCDRAKGWGSPGLRRIGLVDYANFLDHTRVLHVDGAVEAYCTLGTTVAILERESFPTSLAPFVRCTTTALHEAHKAVTIAVETSDPDAERESLRIGTAAASRGLVAAWPLLGSVSAETGVTVRAMRAC
jgi:hypothetical protein